MHVLPNLATIELFAEMLYAQQTVVRALIGRHLQMHRFVLTHRADDLIGREKSFENLLSPCCLSRALTGTESFINNPFTSDPVRYARNAAILEEDPTLGIGSPTVAWADTAFRAMHTFRGANYPSEIRQPILMLAASNDTIVSTAAIEEFAYHLRAGSHLVIAGSRHEILQEQDRYRAQFWAAFDAFVPGTPLFK